MTAADQEPRSVVVDGEGDVWLEQPDGLYECMLGADPCTLEQIANDCGRAVRYVRETRPTPGPVLTFPLDLPSVAECLVRIEAVRVKRRGSSAWQSPSRDRRAASLLQALLRAALTDDVHLADFDAATDLPGACYDVVLLHERTSLARTPGSSR